MRNRDLDGRLAPGHIASPVGEVRNGNVSGKNRETVSSQ